MWLVAVMAAVAACPVHGWTDVGGGWCEETVSVDDHGPVGGELPAPPSGWEGCRAGAPPGGGAFHHAVSGIAGQYAFSLEDDSDIDPWAKAQAALSAACTPPDEGACVEQPETLRTRYTRLLTNVARTLRPTALWLELRTDLPAAWLVYYTALRAKFAPTILTIGGVERSVLSITVRVEDSVVARFNACLAEVIAGTPPQIGTCKTLPAGSVRLPIHVRYRQGNEIINRSGSPWNMIGADAIIDPPCPIAGGERTCSPGRAERMLKHLYVLGQQPAFTYVTKLLPFFPPTGG